ncbi:hypothetical protein PB01_04205 [Psychrobacillus glaciei]|uniref:BIG2 domain-containing protein n=1 Tax=Psychrobacillus glaciei TaxID=2283160 RepID=A0A5J6SKX3_9BACI|nr:S8 family serine peptidase [Psychrobacillus glaciei]QFF98083.1 hypothetical protein PB01_04205 [Psychrobacillus glaciei]
MGKLKYTKFCSSILAFVMVLSMLTPFTVLANEQQAAPIVNNSQSESNLLAKAAIDEQLSLLNGKATLHKDLKGLAGDEEVSVIIHLSEKPVALEKGIKELTGKKFSSSEAVSVEKKVISQQKLVEKEMNAKSISYKEGYSFHTVLNGFGAKVKASDLEKILEIDGVTLIEPDEIRFALDNEESENADAINGNIGEANNTSISFLGIEKVWAKGIKGKGIKVGVVDTGIDYKHPEFAGVYKGGKNFVPNDGDYARHRDDNDPYETAPLDRDPNNPNTPVTQSGSTFVTSHGTHVSGTIAGIGANEFRISGLAPEVELHVYRVLGAYGSGYTSWVIRGIEAAVEEGMDVINLSLGGPSMSSVTADAFAINNAMLAGTVAAVATGNSGSARGSIGSPATAALGIAVGNSTNPTITEKGATLKVKAESYDKSYDLNFMAYKFGDKPGEQLTGEYDLVAIPNFGAAKDYEGIDIKGKVVLVSRGDTTFADKIDVAKKAGAVAVLIHNNTGTGLINSNQSSGFNFITTFDMTFPEGTLLRTALASKPGKVSFSNFTNTVTGGDTLSSSSSRGPTNPDFDIKPDVVAPGTNIMSTIPMYGKDDPGADYSGAFARKTGTSMATPHIAAISALILQANPAWTPFDVKVALSNTAKLLNTTSYDVFAQGPGRVQPFEAAFPTVLAYALDSNSIQRQIIEHEKGTVRFGKLSEISEKDILVTKKIRVEDVAKLGGDYTVDVQITKAFTGATVTVNKPAFKLNGTEMIDVTLKAPKTVVSAAAEILGYVYIRGNGKEISLPFAAEFTPNNIKAVGVSGVKVSDYDLSFHSKSTKKSSTVSGVLGGTGTTKYGEISVELSNLLNNGDEIGTVYYNAGSVPSVPGPVSYSIDGKYTNGNDEIVNMPDGAYSLAIYASNTSGSTTYGDADPEPLFVKSILSTIDTAETHETLKSEYQFNGTIVDDYIKFIKALVAIGYKFDVNEKLSVSYEALNAKGEKIGGGPVTIKQDGAFSIDVANLIEGENSVVIHISDAASNKVDYKYTIIAKNTISYSVNTDKLGLQVGDQGNITVTETTTKLDGTTSVKDVTAQATFASSHDTIAKVENGIVTAVAAGEAVIDVKYADQLIQQVQVVVTEAPVPDVITLIVNNTVVNLTVGGTKQLIVTEVTTPNHGEPTDNIVTEDAEYVVDDESIATVVEGLVTAKAAGKAKVTITHNGHEATVNVTVTDEEVIPNPEPVVTLTVDTKDIKLTTGRTNQLNVTETSTPAEGEATVKDVTAKATYVVANEKIATVSTGGLVTAKAKGTTTIIIKYGENTVEVKVTVTDPVVNTDTGGGGSYYPSQPKVEDMKVETGTTIANTTVKRTTELDGTVKDSVTLNAQNVKDSIKKLKEQNQDTARIVISDNEDKVNEVNVAIPKDAVNAFADGKANLEIFMANGHIYIPQTSMQDFGKDLNFRVVPLKEEAKKNVVEERAKKDTLVQKVAGNKKVNVLGRPMEIETNMQNRSVDLTLPLPKNVTQEQLDNLAIFIEHSDGTKELVQGKIVEFEKDTKGIQFTTNKFSTFTILYVEGAAKYFAQQSCDENAKASCLKVNKAIPMYVLENNRLKKVGEAVKGQNLAVKQTISPMLGLGGDIWLERTAAISYETPSKEMIAKNQLPANKRPKQMWKGLELTPGQIGKVTILEDTVIWESIDKTTKLPRVLKKGEQYRVYRYVPGMYQIGDKQYIVQDSNVVLLKK